MPKITFEENDYFNVKDEINTSDNKEMTLDDLFVELKDVDESDSASMDKVMMYYEELCEDSENFMKLILASLKDFTITWKQPWYQENCNITVKNFKVPKNTETTFLTGTFCEDECDRIKKNWSKFIKKYDLPDKLSSFARWRNRKGSKRPIPIENARKFVTAYLARGLQRTVYQVYRHIVANYGALKKGPYTEDEKKVMNICFIHNPNRATLIASEVLAREPRGIHQRLQSTDVEKHEAKRIMWNLKLATKFLKTLLECTGESIDELKNKPLSIDIWRNVEQKFGGQAEYLRDFWYRSLHCQLFVRYDVTLRRVRRKVFKILKHSPYKRWIDIKWKEVSSQFPDGFTPQFIYWVAVRIFRANKSKKYIIPLPELVKLQLKRLKNKKYGNKRLKTLILNEKGKLKCFKYDAKF